MLTLPALALAYAGFAAVCFAMEKHHRQVWRRPPTRARAVALRAAGCLLLALALLVCVTSFPGSLGFVVWLGALSAAAVPLAFLLPYAPRAAAAAAACAPFAAAAAFAWP